MILTYHDVINNPEFYSVTPEAFAAQMQLLYQAGYHTLTAAQLVAWLRGHRIPPHSVALTFDDGAMGVWQYAEPILARYRFSAIAFVITGFVGTHQPYYMTWPQIQSLQATGRWDIESHTDKGHVYIASGPHGRRGPFLTTLRYSPARHSYETIAHYARRVRTDLAESRALLVSHGMPAPQLFAYPFSAYQGAPQVTRILQHIVSTDFRGAMLDESGGPSITTVADVAAHYFLRLDVTRSESLTTLASRIRAASAMSPAGVSPLAEPRSWWTASDEPARMAVRRGWTTLNPAPGGWVGRLFAPSRTCLWHRYTVRAVLGGLGLRSGTVAGLRVLTGDPQQIQVGVSAGYYQIRQGLDRSEHLLRGGPLPEASGYQVVVKVAPDHVQIFISGRRVATVKLHRTSGLLPAGGIELIGQRDRSSRSLPRIGQLKVSG